MNRQRNRQVKLAIGKVKFEATDPIPNDYWVIFSILGIHALRLIAILFAPKILLLILAVLEKLVGL